MIIHTRTCMFSVVITFLLMGFANPVVAREQIGDWEINIQAESETIDEFTDVVTSRSDGYIRVSTSTTDGRYKVKDGKGGLNIYCFGNDKRAQIMFWIDTSAFESGDVDVAIRVDKNEALNVKGIVTTNQFAERFKYISIGGVQHAHQPARIMKLLKQMRKGNKLIARIGNHPHTIRLSLHGFTGAYNIVSEACPESLPRLNEAEM